MEAKNEMCVFKNQRIRKERCPKFLRRTKNVNVHCDYLKVNC